jgi:hypothetical protein
MQRSEDRTITVVGQWNGWHTAQVRLADMQDVHWFQPTGAPRSLLHGYVPCTDITDGEIPHECERTRRPHRVLVCILKRHTTPATYDELAARANRRAIDDRQVIRLKPAALLWMPQAVRARRFWPRFGQKPG